MKKSLINKAYNIIEAYGDADMDADEIHTLLMMNDIPVDVANKVVADIRPE